MSKKRNEFKFSAVTRLLSFFCSMLFLGTLVFIFTIGFNLAAGLLLIGSIGGLAGPSIVAGESFLDSLADMVELVIEGIQTILEAIADIFSSIFG